MTRQDYGTPRAFIEAVERRFGPIVCDLAAHSGNAKCATWIGKEENSLSVRWAERHPTGLLWLNPEFVDIAPWAVKCCAESQTRHGLIAMLTPASIGTQWFNDYVKHKAFAIGLYPRLTFEGCGDPYPKDLMLSLYGYGLHGFDTWRWAV